MICDNGNSLLQIEIKSGQTVNSDYFKGLEYFSGLSDIPVESSLIYGGTQSYTRNNVQVVGRQSISET